jgi:hypothetical protein
MSQSFWAGVFRNWIWVGTPLMVLALAALGVLIPGLVTLVKNSQLFRVPLAAAQEVEFAEAERVSLSIEGPRGTNRFNGLTFELRGIGGEPVAGNPVWFRSRSSGASTARTEVLTFEIPRAGRYVLAMKGLGAEKEGDSSHAVVFSRPLGASMVATILGIVVASGIFIASLVFFLLRLGKPGAGSPT